MPHARREAVKRSLRESLVILLSLIMINVLAAITPVVLVGDLLLTDSAITEMNKY